MATIEATAAAPRERKEDGIVTKQTATAHSGGVTHNTPLLARSHHHPAAVADAGPVAPTTSRSISAMAKTKPMAAGASAADKKHNTKKGKGNMKGRNGPVAVAMKARGVAAAEWGNPFKAIWSRRKFDVLGKKRKGEERRTSRSRSNGIHKRENTLLKEFEQSAKSSDAVGAS